MELHSPSENKSELIFARALSQNFGFLQARSQSILRFDLTGIAKEPRRPWCLITGPTGSGKTYLACALGHQACRDGFRARYYYAPKLFRELQTAQVDGSLMTLLKRLMRVALLVIDDFGLVAATGKQYRDLLEILDDRHGQGATLITSQFPVSQWHELINDATVADAILDRLVHNAYRLELKGESLRKNKAGLDSTEKNPSD
jgi:DNA replication protein DnaC